MRKYRILYTVTTVIGTFVEVVESDSSDDTVLRKKLNERIVADGIMVDGKHPKVREIIFVETLPQ